MGVVTVLGSMSTSASVIYTHKKFKKATADIWDENNKKKREVVDLNKKDLDVSDINKTSRDFSSHSSYTDSRISNPICEKYDAFSSRGIRCAGSNVAENVSINQQFNGEFVVECLNNELRNDVIFKCDRCNFTSNNKEELHVHNCTSSSKKILCNYCKYVFEGHGSYSSHICVQNNGTSNSGSRGNISYLSDGQDNTKNVQKVAANIIYNRSNSLPVSQYQFAETSPKRLEVSTISQFNTENSITNKVKQIYKPKFRAQYSLQGSPSFTTTCQDSSASSSLPVNSISTFPSTYHENNTNSLSSSTVPVPKNCNNAVSAQTLISNVKISSSSNVLISPKSGDGFSTPTLNTHAANIWKGIKSPSPELVSKHINNLLVQNQAIVDTHNPFWSMKYRRQSSLGSNYTDVDLNSVHKVRRFQINEPQRVNKLCESNISTDSSYASFSNVSASPSLPKSSFSNASSCNSSVCSKSNACSSIFRPMHGDSVPVMFSNFRANSKPSSLQYSEKGSEFLNLSRSTYSDSEKDSLVCSKCGVSVPSIDQMEAHQRTICAAIMTKLTDKPNYINRGMYCNQNEVLNLHKRKTSIFKMEYGQAVSSTVPHSTSFSHRVTFSSNQSMHDTSAVKSPPYKKPCASIGENRAQEKGNSPPIMLFQNGRRLAKVDYGSHLMDSMGKPKSNTNHIYGGHVQICDGKETRTLKIDSIKSEGPSLDMEIASQQMGEFSAKYSTSDQRDAASVVVTISKSGLNSGGTMVKMEKSESSESNKLPLVFNTASSSSGVLDKCPYSVIQSLAPSDQPFLNFKNTFLKYSSTPVAAHQAVLTDAGTAKIPVSKKAENNKEFAPSGVSKSLKLSQYYQVLGTSLPVYNSPSKSPLKYEFTDTYPSVISVGNQEIPFVPGMPGPYSCAGTIIGQRPMNESNKKYDILQTQFKVPQPSMPSPNGKKFESSNEDNASSVSYNSNMLGSRNLVMPNENPLFGTSSSINKLVDVNIPQIKIHPPQKENLMTEKLNPFNVSLYDSKLNYSSEKPITEISIDDNFLVPRKRPDTLTIKQQSFAPKSSLSLIGSTLVSPDTPRPKKTRYQFFINGSAYTNLNFKVSTKSYYCTIFTPQSMYVLQTTNPKLSMYSNWRIIKSDDPLNLSPVEAMSLHITDSYRDSSYTIAKPKVLEIHLTPSAYWTDKNKAYLPRPDNKKTTSDATPIFTNKGEIINDKLPRSIPYEKDFNMVSKSSHKRVKIFEGGFKTNEDYIYVRGRGRGRYVCESCGIRCKKPSMLKKHIRTHTDLRPFACKHCSFSFKTKGNLTKHLKSKAHFKKCSEMGIEPVPTTVDETHFNDKILRLEGESETNKEGYFEAGDLDDDEEEDEDENEEEEDDYEEDYDGDEEDENDTKENYYKIWRENEANKVSTSQQSSFLSDDKELEIPLFTTESTAIADARKSNIHMVPSIWGESDVEKHTDEGFPMDLSIKRPSVIASLPHINSCEGKKIDLPVIFPSNMNDQLGQLDLRYSNTIKSRITPTPYPLPSSVASIRESANEILSPIESSVILKSIYNTTFSISDERSTLTPDPMKETGSCSLMLQNYLKERAMLDSTKKRQQCMFPYIEHHVDSSKLSTQSNSQAQNTVTTVTSQIYDFPDNREQFTSSGISQLSVHGSAAYLPAKRISQSSQTQPLKIAISHDELRQPKLDIKHFEKEKLSSKVFAASKPVFSSIDDLNASISIITTGKTTVNTLASSIANSYVNSTALCNSSSKSLRANYSDSISSSISGKTVVNFSKCCKGNISNSNSRMPVAPTNLTVVNGELGDSRTAFVAPSGIVPSQNRHAPDDGKCFCSICHKEFARQAQLRLHMNIHYIERPHRCDACSVSFRTAGHLQKHKRSVSHFNKVSMNLTFGTPSTTNPRPFKCHDCKIAFRIHGHLAKHLRSKLHIMKLECLEKLPFGTYAEIERSGINLNEIDTSDCENSLDSLVILACKIFEKEPEKLVSWRHQQQSHQPQHVSLMLGKRNRTISNSSTNSEDYPLIDDQVESLGSSSGASTSRSMDEGSGDDEELGHCEPSTNLHKIDVMVSTDSTPIKDEEST